MSSAKSQLVPAPVGLAACSGLCAPPAEQTPFAAYPYQNSV
jgi:hypothetical protein